MVLMRPGLSALLLALAGCTLEPAPTDGSAGSPAVRSVRVQPDSVRLDRYDTLRLSAAPLGPAGAPVAGVAIEWTSSFPVVADVGPDGLVRAYGGGVATITARAGDQAGTAHVRVASRESFNMAVLYGAVRDSRGNPVTRSALRATAWVQECSGTPLIASKFGTSGGGTYRRLVAAPSILESFPGCVIIHVAPLGGSGLRPLTTPPLYLRFVDNLRGLPVDSLRVDLVLEDSLAGNR